MAPRRLTVPPDAPARLDAFLVKALPAFGRERILKLLADGRVKVNGKKAKPLRRIVGGEEVELDVPDAAPPRARAESAQGPKLKKLYEDAGLLIIDKPNDLVVERDERRASVVSLAAVQFKGFDVGGLTDPGVVHRLDKDTTGCLMLAKTDDSVLELERGFQEKRIKKTYLALVLGTPPPTGTLDTPYGRHPEDPRLYTSRFPSPRRARLSWKTVSSEAGKSLLEIDLDTGRTHQIRAQLADVGHPLLGDWLYGTEASRALGIGRTALHALRLELRDVGGRTLTIEAPLPEDFRRGMSPRS